MRLATALLLSTVGLVALIVAPSLALAGGALSAGPAPATPRGPTYNATFTETGLPAGTNWSVKLTYVGCGCDGVHGTFTTNGNSLTVALTNGTYRYNALPVPNYVSSDSRGTLTVAGASPTTVTVVFQPIVQYTAVFLQSGLPTGTNWTVSLTGNGTDQAYAMEHQSQSTNNSSLSFSLLNGTYHYVVGKVAGSYFAGPSHGVFVVNGAAPAPIDVTFVTPPQYAVTFHESGLANGTNWTVRISGFGGVRIAETVSASTSNLSVLLPNGTYRFAVGEVLGYDFVGASTGHFTVSSGPVSENVTFEVVGPAGFFAVTFDETGLSAGHHWHVTIVATHTFGHSRTAGQSSNTTSLTFDLQNGTYRYTVWLPRAYTSSSTTGTFTVAGASPPQINVTFVPIPRFTVTVTETGLTAGTNWSVLVKTSPGEWSAWPVYVTRSSTGSSISFSLPNGSYCYRVYPVPYYTVSSGTLAGSFTVAGGPVSISIGFTAKS